MLTAMLNYPSLTLIKQTDINLINSAIETLGITLPKRIDWIRMQNEGEGNYDFEIEQAKKEGEIEGIFCLGEFSYKVASSERCEQ
jgi:hypothetical protein